MAPEAYGGGEAGRKTHEELLTLHKEILEKSGVMWNWPSVATLSPSSLARILYLRDLYERILPYPGDIFEFGVHFGGGASTLVKLSALLEPRNKSREFHFFDTFTGFPSVSPISDGISEEGDFFVGLDYVDTLERLLELVEKLERKSGTHPNRHRIHVGDAVAEFEKLLRAGWKKRISLLILDLDLYEPSKRIVELATPFLASGSVIVLDEYGSSDYPGEAVLERELSEKFRFTISRHPLMPYGCQLEIC